MVSIRLIQDALLTSTCDTSNFSRGDTNLRKRRLALPADMLVIWNFPTSDITEQYLPQPTKAAAATTADDHASSSAPPLVYTLWNVSFPVYDWGSQNIPRLVQKDVQHLLEQKIWHEKLGVPIPGSMVSIQGEEDFAMPPILPTMSPTIKRHHQRPEEDISALLNGPRRIQQRDAHMLMVIGAMLIVIQTIFSLLLHQYGKNFRLRRALHNEKQKVPRSAEEKRDSVDQMLRSSKGYVEMDRRGSLGTRIEPSAKRLSSARLPSKQQPGGRRKATKNKVQETQSR